MLCTRLHAWSSEVELPAMPETEERGEGLGKRTLLALSFSPGSWSNWGLDGAFRDRRLKASTPAPTTLPPIHRTQYEGGRGARSTTAVLTFGDLSAVSTVCFPSLFYSALFVFFFFIIASLKELRVKLKGTSGFFIFKMETYQLRTTFLTTFTQLL